MVDPRGYHGAKCKYGHSLVIGETHDGGAGQVGRMAKRAGYGVLEGKQCQGLLRAANPNNNKAPDLVISRAGCRPMALDFRVTHNVGIDQERGRRHHIPGGQISSAEKHKDQKYKGDFEQAGYSFKPFIATSQGGLSQQATDFITQCTAVMSPESKTQQAALAKYFQRCICLQVVQGVARKTLLHCGSERSVAKSGGGARRSR